MKKWYIPVAWLAAVLLIWGILPLLIAGICNIGVIVPTAVGTVGVIAAVFYRKTERIVYQGVHSSVALRVISVLITAAVALLVLLFLTVSLMMLCNANRTTSDTEVTLVIPGAKIHDDRPSLMLNDRITTAAEYLKAHPHVPCVVSGGQGEDEKTSEAAVMYDYLVAAGIDPARIFVEDRSTNTFENMQYTYDVIRQNGLPERVVIVTQEFHQYRCAQYARKVALQPVGTATCDTPFYFFLCYWVREFAGICRMWMLGY